MEKHQLTIILPKTTVREIDTFIDGVKIRNRSHLIHIAVDSYLEKERENKKGQQTNIRPIKKRGKK